MTNGPAAKNGQDAMQAPGLGGSRRDILRLLKRRGAQPVAGLARELGLNRETVREHVAALEEQGLVARAGTGREAAERGAAERGAARRGRPELLFGLTAAAERLFPQRDGALLAELAGWLAESGHEGLLHDFLEAWIGARRAEAMARVEGLDGRARLEEVARILSEDGFMAEVEGVGGAATLRLVHCPIRGLVDATRLPCRQEIAFVTELVGRPLTRLSYIPAGDGCCSYVATTDG